MDIEKNVKNILSELSGEKTISLRSTLSGDLMLDSLSMVTLLIEIEEKFNIQLDESDMNPFDLNTVQDIINMLKKYCGKENE